MSKPHVVQIGFDPRKPVSSVSFVCSECGKHVTPPENYESVQCENCGAILDGMEWEPPKDIRQALEKQKPLLVYNTSESLMKHAVFGYHIKSGQCSFCHYPVNTGHNPNFCPNCGQRLDWGKFKWI